MAVLAGYVPSVAGNNVPDTTGSYVPEVDDETVSFTADGSFGSLTATLTATVEISFTAETDWSGGLTGTLTAGPEISFTAEGDWGWGASTLTAQVDGGFGGHFQGPGPRRTGSGLTWLGVKTVHSILPEQESSDDATFLAVRTRHPGV